MLLAAGFMPYVIIAGFLKIIPLPTGFGMVFCWLGSLIFAGGSIGFLLCRTSSSWKAATAAVLGFCLASGHAMICTYPFILDDSSFYIR